MLVLGAVATGKTTIARRLSEVYSIPIIHVDSIEFNTDLSKREIGAVKSEIVSALTAPEWILDGYGPLDLLPTHLKNADLIVFLDFPLMLNLIFLLKRQTTILFSPRSELPKHSKEWKWIHIKKLFQTLFKQHRLMNPELLRILARPENSKKLVHIISIKDFKEFYSEPNFFAKIEA